jgi:hypothetical protein
MGLLPLRRDAGPLLKHGERRDALPRVKAAEDKRAPLTTRARGERRRRRMRRVLWTLALLGAIAGAAWVSAWLASQPRM